MEGLGQRLKRARLRLAADEGHTISPKQLGARVGLTGQAIGRYEAGAREPDLGMIVRLAAALGITPGWLAFGDAATVVPELPSPPIVNGDELPPGHFPVPSAERTIPVVQKKGKRGA